ncbi:MAG: choice-of-anchor J domain-containing protein [bacterium]|nr:choice-of-anchor J domain-containing protein [Candidatus Colousia faecequi]
MKRFLIVMALMLALCVPWAHGQTLNEGFGGSAFPPDEWTTIHVSGVNYFGVNSDAAYVNYASNSHENYLVTPQLAPKSGESLSFYVKTQTFSGTTLTIEVSTTGNAAADFTTTLATYTSPIATSYTLKSIDLSAYVGQNIYILLSMWLTMMEVLSGLTMSQAFRFIYLLAVLSRAFMPLTSRVQASLPIGQRRLQQPIA